MHRGLWSWTCRRGRSRAGGIKARKSRVLAVERCASSTKDTGCSCIGDEGCLWEEDGSGVAIEHTRWVISRDIQYEDLI